MNSQLTQDKARSIRKLDETVVNRIAAGEVIQRPANALKELLENSLDAKSTSIQVTVQEGGLKLLKIQDNGTGINKEDFPIVCERFTTSKLEKFEDLTSLGTYGFRGEALASISHVARLTIITKTVDMQCAYKCAFNDGKLVGTAKPCAGTQGTQIMVEDLFYNVPTRRNALKSSSEEHNRIIEVVTRFAVHNASVGFCLKKLSDNSNDVRTPVNSNAVDNIRILYGNQVAKDLVKLEVNDQAYKFKASGWVSSVDYGGPKFTMLLFINHRLVESTMLKKSLDNVYSAYLAKGKHPFVYLSMEIAPQNVDVNVHPTKHEVHFLHEESIIHKIQTAVDLLLKGASTSRSFTVQTVLPSTPSVERSANSSLAKENTANKVYDKMLVRTDSRNQKIDKFLTSSVLQDSTLDNSAIDESVQQITNRRNERGDSTRTSYALQDPLFEISTVDESFFEESANETSNAETTFGEPFRQPAKRVENVRNSAASIASRPLNLPARSDKNSVPERRIEIERESEPRIQVGREHLERTMPRENPQLRSDLASGRPRRRTFELTSLRRLREEIKEKSDPLLREMFRDSTFVGCINDKHCLIQYQTRLYIIQMQRVTEEYFYQTLLNEFGNFGTISLSHPPPLYDLVLMALDDEENQWTPEDGPKDELAANATGLLASKAEMLDDYFSIEIDTERRLSGIPLLLVDFIPDLSRLHSFVLLLATEVNWREEKPCFDSVSRVIANLYRKPDNEVSSSGSGKSWEWTIEHVLYPCIKSSLVPPKCWLENGSIIQIADLPELYKVFERC